MIGQLIHAEIKCFEYKLFNIYETQIHINNAGL